MDIDWIPICSTAKTGRSSLAARQALPKIRHRLVALSGLLGFSFCHEAAASQAKDYVVSWFYTATYSQDGDCPYGLNDDIETHFRKILASLGKSQPEIEGAVKAIPGAMYVMLGDRGRIDGKPVSPYLYPTSVPDPQIKTLKGKVGYGFNLDGKDGPDDFVDPETGEQGVDNQLYRVLGCFVPQRAFPPDRPGYPSAAWDMPRDAMAAWLIEVTGEDLSKDGDVTIGLYQATAPVMRGADGAPIPDMTFRVSGDPRSYNVVHGHMSNGVVTSDSFTFNMLGDIFYEPEFHLSDARIRLALKSDGTARGILGGYEDWRKIYSGYASGGVFNEAVVSLDIPGIYYALKRMADAYPDPKTGENMAISAAYAVEAVPAFIVHDNKTAAAEAPAQNMSR
jgi:hypothetical protein